MLLALVMLPKINLSSSLEVDKLKISTSPLIPVESSVTHTNIHLISVNDSASVTFDLNKIQVFNLTQNPVVVANDFQPLKQVSKEAIK